MRHSMPNQMTDAWKDEQSSTDPFSQLTTELMQMIWLYCDSPEQFNLRLVNHSFESKVRQIYTKKWFTRRAHLCTRYSLQALLGIASTEYQAENVQQLELVLVDFIFAKGSHNMRPRSRVPNCLLRSVSESPSVQRCYLSQAERTDSWKSENTWLWEEKNVTTLLEQVFEKFSKLKLNSITITSTMGEMRPYGTFALQNRAILTPKDGQADLDKDRTFLPVLAALEASKSRVDALKVDEVKCLGSFLDAWPHAQDLWTNIRSLDVCLLELFKHQHSDRRQALASLLSKCGKLEDLKLVFESDYDQRDDGGCFSEILQSLREVPLRHFTAISMAMRKVDLNSLLLISTIQSVKLYNIHCNGLHRHNAAFVNLDEHHWAR